MPAVQLIFAPDIEHPGDPSLNGRRGPIGQRHVTFALAIVKPVQFPTARTLQGSELPSRLCSPEFRSFWWSRTPPT